MWGEGGGGESEAEPITLYICYITHTLYCREGKQKKSKI